MLGALGLAFVSPSDDANLRLRGSQWAHLLSKAGLEDQKLCGSVGILCTRNSRGSESPKAMEDMLEHFPIHHHLGTAACSCKPEPLSKTAAEVQPSAKAWPGNKIYAQIS